MNVNKNHWSIFGVFNFLLTDRNLVLNGIIMIIRKIDMIEQIRIYTILIYLVMISK
jgi:hypothetical protein